MLDYEVLNVIIGDLIIKTVVECKQSIIRISIIYFYSGCFLSMEPAWIKNIL